MGASVNVKTVNYQDQKEFDRFFATAFDKYDRNRDGKIDYREFQPLVNEMCQLITKKYGAGATVDKIKQAWYAMDTNRSGTITRQEFSTKAKREVERILSQPSYGPQAGHGVQHGHGVQPGYGAQPGHGAHPGQHGYAPGPQHHAGYIPPTQQKKW